MKDIPIDHADPRKCGRKTSGGYACKKWAMHGQTVCRMHGGASPQARAKAEERLRALVHPAITGLAELIKHADQDSVRLSAIRDVLDRTGFKPALQQLADTDSPTLHVTVTFDRADQDQDHPALPGS